jgi:hypothetical protein
VAAFAFILPILLGKEETDIQMIERRPLGRARGGTADADEGELNRVWQVIYRPTPECGQTVSCEVRACVDGAHH